MRNVYASDAALLQVGLERVNTELEDDRSGIDELLSAVDVLTHGWLQPFGVGFQLVYCDPSAYFEEVGRPDVPHHFLRAAEIPATVLVREAFSNSAVEHCPRVDTDAVRKTVTRGIEQPTPKGCITTLSELKWTSVRALAPTDEPVVLDFAGRSASPVSEVIDGHLWYCGPTSGLAGTPARLRAVNDHFAVSIQLEVLWDLWIGQVDGRLLLEAGVSRVLARAGWVRTA